MSKSLVIPRSNAFSHQNGYCYYYGQPMWNGNPKSFANKYKLTLPQTKSFQCTGEHLKAHQDGGSSSLQNIVAACHFCNQKRHQRKKSLTPKQFKSLVQQRVNRNGWRTPVPHS